MTRSRISAAGIVLLALALFALTMAARPTVPPPAKEAGQVTPTASLLVRRFDQTATLLPNGKVLIAGGMEANGVYGASAELYDPQKGTFVAAASMSVARACHTATLLPNGKILLAGGAKGPDEHVSTAELYDPATGRFQPTGSMSGPRCGAIAVLLKSGKVLMIGGEGAHEDERVNSAELYDPATGRFTPTGSMRVARDTHAAVLLKDGRVLVVGGSSAGRYPNNVIEASAEIYDPATGRFATTGSMSTARHKLAAALLPDGRVLVAGGSDNRDWRGQYTSAEIYDPANGRFSNAGDMHFKRFKLMHAMVLLPDGKVLIAGGAEQPEIYDAAARSFQTVDGAVGDSRYFSTATVLADGRVLIAGGYGRDAMAGAVSNAWLYRP